MKHAITIQAMAILMIALILTLPVCFADTLSLEYDANGNLVTGDGLYRVYNSLNQLSKVYNGSSEEGTLLETFVFHPTEERVLMKKSYHENGSVKETIIYLSKSFVHVKNESGRFNITYIYHNGQLVGQQTAQGATTNKVYIHGDHLGSTTSVTDEGGNVLENSSYTPFGEITYGGQQTRYGYEGKEHDLVLGDTDFHFRKYKPEWGIFTQPDTLIQNVYDPQSLNHYMFERGNPYASMDFNGHAWWFHHQFETKDAFLKAGFSEEEANRVARASKVPDWNYYPDWMLTKEEKALVNKYFDWLNEIGIKEDSIHTAHPGYGTDYAKLFESAILSEDLDIIGFAAHAIIDVFGTHYDMWMKGPEERTHSFWRDAFFSSFFGANKEDTRDMLEKYASKAHQFLKENDKSCGTGGASSCGLEIIGDKLELIVVTPVRS